MMNVHCTVGILCALLGWSASAVAAAGKADVPDEAFRRIDEYAARVMSFSGTPGMALGVTSADETLHVASLGYADLKRRRPVDESTLFQIGSISKTFTALMLLALAEEGKVDLEAPVKQTLPWFSVRSDYAGITARHLLTHTAGIPANRDDLPSTPYMALALREQETAWPPGTRFHYSNVGYQVLSVLLETAAGRPIEAIEQRRIFDPLGMASTEPAITYEMAERQAVGYIYADGTRPAHRSRALAQAPFFEYRMGDGNIASTATDMTAFLRLLLRRGMGPNGPVVSAAAFQQFIQPGVSNEDGSGYGYGVLAIRSGGRLVLEHTGGMVGHLSHAAADLDAGFGVVVLQNGPGRPGAVLRYALEVLRAAGGGEPLPEIPPLPDPFKVENAGDYAGTYHTPAGEVLTVEAREDSLWVGVGKQAVRLERTGENRFYSLDPGLDLYYLRFQRDDSGRVVGATHGPRWFTNEHYEGPTKFEVPGGWDRYVGRYHSPSPWFSGFTVFIRQGELWTVTDGGGETTAGQEVRLEPLGGGVFFPETAPTPERVVFSEVIDGHAWRATWSGHRFYRTGIN